MKNIEKGVKTGVSGSGGETPTPAGDQADERRNWGKKRKVGWLMAR